MDVNSEWFSGWNGIRNGIGREWKIFMELGRS